MLFPIIIKRDVTECNVDLRNEQIERLRYQISLVQKGQAFLLHAGDCAESFDACTQVSHSYPVPLIKLYRLSIAT